MIETSLWNIYLIIICHRFHIQFEKLKLHDNHINAWFKSFRMKFRCGESYFFIGNTNTFTCIFFCVLCQMHHSEHFLHIGFFTFINNNNKFEKWAIIYFWNTREIFYSPKNIRFKLSNNFYCNLKKIEIATRKEFDIKSIN